MKAYASDQLRNLVLMGHGGSGKTTLAEAMLFVSGAISRMGKVEDRNTVSDFDEQEHQHHYSISTSLIPVEWAGTKLNVLDAPGYPDFEGEAIAAAAAADAAVITVDAVGGIQSGSEVAWDHADEAGIRPRFIIVTRLDRENADFDAVLAALRGRFGTGVVPLAIPIGVAGSFAGVVDLASGTAIRGADGAAGEVPADVAGAVESARDMLVESVAETDEELLNDYLEGNAIDDARLQAALPEAVRGGSVIPVFPVSGTSAIGVKLVMDAASTLLPSPVGRERLMEGGATVTVDPSGPLVAHVFKTTADPFVGRLTYMRVLSGTLKPDANPYNVQHATQERLGHLFAMRGKEQIGVPELVAGDIGVAAKLTVTTTGDTFVASEASKGTRVPPLPFPEPTYRSAVHPRTKADVDKLSQALARITEQDPTIHVSRDPDTGETIMTTIGDAQAAIAAARLEKNFGVAVDIAEPRVPYRETITSAAKSEYKHKKQTGGHGQYGHVVIQIDPAQRGAGFTFAEKVVGGNVPKQFIPAVEKGIMETLPTGPLAHSPIVDVQVTLLDGSAHAVDSSEMAFKLAAGQALKQGMLQAHPILLEPVARVIVRVPADRVGDVMSDLNGRRGHVHGVEPAGAFSVVEAEAPLAEVQRYAVDLRALSHGRGRCSVTFDHYAEVPAHVQDQVLKQLTVAEA
ncbi:MAG: elongation factor G [Dehalococcoidia bacterium]